MSGKTMWAVAVVLALAGVTILAARKIGSAPEQSPKPWPDVGEKKILDVLDQMLSGPHSEILSVPPDDGRVLRLLAEATGARNIVEVGTSNGYASLWFCLALRTTGGKLTTFEIDPKRVLLALENFKRAGVGKLVTIIEGDAHKTILNLKEPIDIVFLDADKGGNLDYLKKLLPLVRPGGLILAHDTTDSVERMQDYLEAVTTDPALETVFLNKSGPGIGVTLKKRRSQ
ncbi:MAG: class I SAM-dependent methyltransferase [Phycisphaerales bacterium]|nr:MAG: class I SAM-dependent methyltransferase [Phycisphaerales bacterium]